MRISDWSSDVCSSDLVFIREMERNRKAGYRVVGLLDEKATRQGRDLRGIRVLGGVEELIAVIDGLPERDRPRRIIVTDDRLAGSAIRHLVEAAAQQIGRASCRERVCSTCRSRWSPYH